MNDTDEQPGAATGARRDCLVVVQSNPLVWFDQGQHCHTLPPVNVYSEKRNIEASLNEASSLGHGVIDIVCAEATSERLFSLLTNARSPALHYSGHGAPDYLALENNGAMRPFHVQMLKEFHGTRKKMPTLLFLACEHSRRFGEAFVEFGIPHVICFSNYAFVQQEALNIFSKALYASLAEGEHLKTAFQNACNNVGTSQMAEDARHEADKFVLLPETTDNDPYHDVPIFYESARPSTQASPSRKISIPTQPSLLIGREIDTYKLVRELASGTEEGSARLVLLQGPKGIGKCSLANAVCKYVCDRSQQFSIDVCEWVPFDFGEETDLHVKLHEVHDMIRDEKITDIGSKVLKAGVKSVVTAIQSNRTLIAVDARDAVSEASTMKLDFFLKSLFHGTSQSRVIVVCPPSCTFSFNPGCPSLVFLLKPLELNHSVLLFGNNCQFVVGDMLVPGVGSTEDLVELLVPELPSGVIPPSIPFFDVLDGAPGKLIDAANTTTELEYVKLIRTGVNRIDNDIIPLLEGLLQESNEFSVSSDIEQCMYSLKETRRKFQSDAEFEEIIKAREKENVLLFGNNCQFVGEMLVPGAGSTEDLVELLVPELPSGVIQTSIPFFDILKGDPGKIIDAAKTVTELEFVKLIQTGVNRIDNDIMPLLEEGRQESIKTSVLWDTKQCIRSLKEMRRSFPSDGEFEEMIKAREKGNDSTMWSISYEQLMEVHQKASNLFGEDYDVKTMRDVNEHIIKPVCERTGTSYALHLNRDGLEADVFVTHAWSEPFPAFVESIRKAFAAKVKKPNLWICSFALVQGDHETVGRQVDVPVDVSPFVQALKNSSTFLVVRNSATDLYSRIWCVCELIFAKKFGLYPDKTHVVGPNNFSELRTSCQEAESSIARDKERILDVLRKDHDVAEIDAIVQQFRTHEFNV